MIAFRRNRRVRLVAKELICIGIGLLLAWAAIAKAINSSSIVLVFLFDGLPNWSVKYLVWTLIACEIVLGGWLITGAKRRWAILSVIALFLIFTLQVGYLLVRTDAPTCGCIGKIMEFKEVRHNNIVSLGRNICLIAALLIAYALSTRRYSHEDTKALSTGPVG